MGGQLEGPALGLLLPGMPPTKQLLAKQPLSLQGPRPRKDKECSGLESASLASSCDFPDPETYGLPVSMQRNKQKLTGGHVRGGRTKAAGSSSLEASDLNGISGQDSWEPSLCLPAVHLHCLQIEKAATAETGRGNWLWDPLFSWKNEPEA